MPPLACLTGSITGFITISTKSSPHLLCFVSLVFLRHHDAAVLVEGVDALVREGGGLRYPRPLSLSPEKLHMVHEENLGRSERFLLLCNGN